MNNIFVTKTIEISWIIGKNNKIFLKKVKPQIKKKIF